MDATDNPATWIMLLIEFNFVDEVVQVPNLNEKTKVSKVKLILEDEYPRELRNRSYYLKLKCNQTRLDDDCTLEHYGISDQDTLEVEFVDTSTSSPPPSERPPLSLKEESHQPILEDELVDTPTSSPPPSERPPLSLKEESHQPILEDELVDTPTSSPSSSEHPPLSPRESVGDHRTAVDLLSTTLNVNSKASFYYEPDHELFKSLTEFINSNLTTTYLNFTSIHDKLYKIQSVTFINIQTEPDPTELSDYLKMRDLLDKTNDLKTGKQAPKNIPKENKMDKPGYNGKLSYAAQKSSHSMTNPPEDTCIIMHNAFPQVMAQECTQVVHTLQIVQCGQAYATQKSLKIRQNHAQC